MDELHDYTIHKLQKYGKLDVGVENLNYSDFEKCRIYADLKRLRQVLVHLLDHAVKSTDTGYILFGFQTTKTDMIKFYVEDTGEYISENHQLFNFKQSNQEERFNDCLGLFISHGLVQLMGKKLIITKTSESAGTIFSFSIVCNPCEIV